MEAQGTSWEGWQTVVDLEIVKWRPSSTVHVVMDGVAPEGRLKTAFHRTSGGNVGLLLVLRRLLFLQT